MLKNSVGSILGRRLSSPIFSLFLSGVAGHRAQVADGESPGKNCNKKGTRDRHRERFPRPTPHVRTVLVVVAKSDSTFSFVR